MKSDDIKKAIWDVVYENKVKADYEINEDLNRFVEKRGTFHYNFILSIERGWAPDGEWIYDKEALLSQVDSEILQKRMSISDFLECIDEEDLLNKGIFDDNELRMWNEYLNENYRGLSVSNVLTLLRIRKEKEDNWILGDENDENYIENIELIVSKVIGEENREKYTLINIENYNKYCEPSIIVSNVISKLGIDENILELDKTFLEGIYRDIYQLQYSLGYLPDQNSISIDSVKKKEMNEYLVNEMVAKIAVQVLKPNEIDENVYKVLYDKRFNGKIKNEKVAKIYKDFCDKQNKIKEKNEKVKKKSIENKDKEENFKSKKVEKNIEKNIENKNIEENIERKNIKNKNVEENVENKNVENKNIENKNIEENVENKNIENKNIEENNESKKVENKNIEENVENKNIEENIEKNIENKNIQENIKSKKVEKNNEGENVNNKEILEDEQDLIFDEKDIMYKANEEFILHNENIKNNDIIKKQEMVINSQLNELNNKDEIIFKQQKVIDKQNTRLQVLEEQNSRNSFSKMNEDALKSRINELEKQSEKQMMVIEALKKRNALLENIVEKQNKCIKKMLDNFRFIRESLCKTAEKVKPKKFIEKLLSKHSKKANLEIQDNIEMTANIEQESLESFNKITFENRSIGNIEDFVKQIVNEKNNIDARKEKNNLRGVGEGFRAPR